MGVKVREKPIGSGIYWIFINHHGKRKSKKIGDERLANEVAKKIEAKLVLGDMSLINKNELTIPTLSQYVYGWEDAEGIHPGWLYTEAELSLKNSTRLSYKQILRDHLLPDFGVKQLDEITSRIIGDMVYKKFDNGLRSGTIKNIKNTLSAILRHAQNQGGVH